MSEKHLDRHGDKDRSKTEFFKVLLKNPVALVEFIAFLAATGLIGHHIDGIGSSIKTGISNIYQGLRTDIFYGGDNENAPKFALNHNDYEEGRTDMLRQELWQAFEASCNGKVEGKSPSTVAAIMMQTLEESGCDYFTMEEIRKDPSFEDDPLVVLKKFADKGLLNVGIEQNLERWACWIVNKRPILSHSSATRNLDPEQLREAQRLQIEKRGWTSIQTGYDALPAVKNIVKTVGNQRKNFRNQNR